MREAHEAWVNAMDNQFVIFVRLGSPAKNEGPRYWIATKQQVGQACIEHSCHGTTNWERRFGIDRLKADWENVNVHGVTGSDRRAAGGMEK